MKKLIALALSAALTLGSALALSPEEAFPQINDYPGYADVAAGQWYSTPVQTCYEVGLLIGTDAGFAPSAPITQAQLATITARIRAALTGETLPSQGDPWFQVYVDYLAPLGIAVSAPNANATRLEFFQMLAKVTPDELLTPVNEITSLPDTNDPDVLRFYRAGILTGVDIFGTFAPDKPLNRAEVAAMVARIVRPALRMVGFRPVGDFMYESARLTPNQVVFQKGGVTLTAETWLKRVFAEIYTLERTAQEAGVEFFWSNKTADGVTYLYAVKENPLAGTGLTWKDRTAVLDGFDIPEVYARYITRRGGPL